MGFLDKLRGAANKAVDAVQSINNPLPNETAKKFYEIVYGLLTSFGGVNYNGIKNYVEYHIGQQCDETTLQQVVVWFSDPQSDKKVYYRPTEGVLTSRAHFNDKGYTVQKVEKLIEINKALEATPTYRCTFEEGCDICYKDILEVVESVKGLSGNEFSKAIENTFADYKDVIGQVQIARMVYMTCREEIINNFKPTYDKVLDIAEDRGVQYFGESVKNLFTKYEKLFGTHIVEEIIQTLVEGSCAEGNEIAKAYLSKKKH